ncbi:MAG: STAS domain-containing protein [Pyrinomonadaceae bacterium]
MATQIKQIDDNENSSTILRVDGEMTHGDALLLERIAMGIRGETNNSITIDLADLNFLDSEAAPILKRLADMDGFAITGVEIFLQSVVNEAERHGT